MGNWKYKYHDIEVDKTAPFVEITNPGDNTIHKNSVELRGTVTDDNPHHYWLQIKKNGSVINTPGVTGTTNTATNFTDKLFTTLTEEGEYEVTLAARDAAGGGSSTGNRSGNVVINFTIDKSSPDIDISNIDVSSDKKLSFDLLATDNGPSGLQIIAANIYNETNTTKLIELGSGFPTRLNLPHSGLPAGTPLFSTSLDNIDVSGLAAGTYTIRAYAKDHAGNELRFELVQFEIDNTSPTVDAGDDDTVTGLTYNNLDGSSSDSDSGVVSTLWELVSGPGTASFDDDSNEDTSVTVSNYGEYTFSLTVTDNAGNDSTDEVVITFEEEPTITSASNNVGGGNGQFNFQGAGGGNDGFVPANFNFGALPAQQFIAFGQGNPGAVNGANDNNQNGNNNDGDNDDGQVAAGESGVSSASTEGNSEDTGGFSFSWWWLLLLLAPFLIYLFYRRINQED